MSVTITTTPVLVTLDTELQSTVISVNSVSVNVSNQFPENPIFNSITFDTMPVNIPTAIGTLFYDENDNALTVRLPNGVTNQISEEVFFGVLNKSGSKMLNGKLVYIDGAQGNRVTVSYATNATCASASRCIAMLTQDIEKNEIGKATFIGLVRGLNTQGVTEGTELWLGTNGDYTTTQPATGTARVRIGRLAKEHVSDGHVLVFIQQDKYMFGNRDGGNYSVFEDDGTLVHHGDARTFKDMICDVLNLRQQGTGISYNVSENTVEFTTGSDLNDYLYANVQLNHDRDLTTQIFPHIHAFQTTSGRPNYLLEYRWQRNGQPKTTVWTRLIFGGSAFTYVSGTLNQIFYTAGITPPANSGISDILQIRIYRDNSNASGLFTGTDPVNATVGLTSFDIHYASNKSGSRTEYQD